MITTILFWCMIWYLSGILFFLFFILFENYLNEKYFYLIGDDILKSLKYGLYGGIVLFLLTIIYLLSEGIDWNKFKDKKLVIYKKKK